MYEAKTSSGLVVLVDDRRLRRAALLALLAVWAESRGYALEAPDCASYDEISAGGPFEDADLILLSVGSLGLGDPDYDACVGRLRELAASRPTLVLGDCDDYETIAALVSLGAKGYLPMSTPPEIGLSVLEFVLRGGTYFPPTALSARRSDERRPSFSDIEETGDTLTTRQREVLSLLRQGKPNKVIARDLSMRESTVKVHVRQILRKLGATNRTQAALCAASADHDPRDTNGAAPAEASASPEAHGPQRSSATLTAFPGGASQDLKRDGRLDRLERRGGLP